MLPSLTALALCIALLLPGLPAAARDLTIAAWNFEHLAEHTGAGCNPRTDADYKLLRSYADKLNADVIAFQEVESAGAAQQVFKPEKYVIEISAQHLRAGYDCGRHAPEGNKSTKQLTGFAIRKGLDYTRNPDFTAIDVSDNSSLRAATDITLMGKRPLRLLSVHLKANCTSQPLTGDKRECQALAKQQPVLEQGWMEARHRADEAFVVLGDFNRHLLTPGDEFWAATNDGEPASLRMTALSSPNEGLCSKRYPKRIDHIVVDNRAAPSVKANSFKVLTYAAGDAPSDHCPISAVLNLR